MLDKIKSTSLKLVTGLLCISLLAGCATESPNKKIVGTWGSDTSSVTFTFHDNGTVSDSYGETGTWSITEDSTLVMTVEGDTVSCKIAEISSNTMIWKIDEKTMKLERIN